MTQLTREELSSLIEESDLFQEFFQLPDAHRYRQALARAAAWRLEPGEALPEPGSRRGAYALLQGAAALEGAPAPEEGAAPLPPRRVFGQWTGLRDQPLEEVPVATEPAVLLECRRDLLDLLLGEAASRFKVEFYAPLLRDLEPIADAPPEIEDEVARKSKFALHRDGSPIVRQGEFGSTMFFVLAGSARVEAGEGFILGRHDFFGEIAVLTYQPRGATVTARGDCLVMECDRDAVGDLRKKSKIFKELMEQLYRERAMLTQLQSTTLFQDLERAELEAVRDIATLESYDPYQPVFFQGDTANALYLVLNGTMTVVEQGPEGPLPIAWVRSGETVGEMALLPHISGTDRRQQTVTALQRVDAIRIPADAFERILRQHPTVSQKMEQTARQRMEQNTRFEQDTARAVNLGWMLETQHVAGNWVLAVDMNDCIRCNNCVTACESTHADGLNRFFWGNMRQDEDVMPHVRFSNSCQHCDFAPCVKVCPTNALQREALQGSVFIDYDLCIRCGKCADPSQGCPYGSIYVVPADQVSRQAAAPFWQQLLQLFGRKPAAPAAPDAKAGKNYPVKCDLCHDLPYQACVHHCPTGAVFRVDGDQQFAQALAKPAAAPSGNRPTGRPIALFLKAEFPQTPVAGRPAELVVTVGKEGPGLPLLCREPEQGVAHVRLNLYLTAPDGFRIGGGGPLRQLIIPVDRPEGETDYAMTIRTPGPQQMTLSAYQGGLYLGRTTLSADFVK